MGSSQFELSYDGLLEDLLTSVFESAGAGHSLRGAVALHRDLRVLLPAADVRWHVLELDLFAKEDVHLLFDRVLVTVLHEGSAEVDHTHVVEVLVGARKAAHHAELRIKQVLTVASVGNTVIYNLLKDDLHRRLGVEAQVLAVTSDDLTVLLEALLYRRGVRGLVLN